MTTQHILIIEDDERIGSTLLRALIGSGYDARLERTGERGVSAACEQRPDLVLLDLGLPDGDGLEVCVSKYFRTTPQQTERVRTRYTDRTPEGFLDRVLGQ